MRLRRIDELVLDEYPFLNPRDDCYFLRTYTAGTGYLHGETNSLISNLKKPPSLRAHPQWRHKEQAIRQLATELRTALGAARISRNTYVPVPPSRVQSDPEYDDRLIRLLEHMAVGLRCDLREIVRQRRSSRASHHQGSSRLSPREIGRLYEIDDSKAVPVPTKIVVVDDVLTTGAHFVAMRDVLKRRFPAAAIVGLFVARAVHRRSG